MADTEREARERFAANVERLRRREGLSADSLADRAAVDRLELAAILRAEKEASYETIARLAGALAVPPGELLEGIRWVPAAEGHRARFEVERPPEV